MFSCSAIIEHQPRPHLNRFPSPLAGASATISNAASTNSPAADLSMPVRPPRFPPDGRPVALTLQQHNYLRSHLVGESVRPGPDGRFDIDVAIRSNELYPHAPGRTVRRAVRFLDDDARAFMMGFGERPTMSADDITDPERSVSYELAFLPGANAFYAFQDFLGERRSLPGRDGPPGARYNTLSALKPLPAQILDGYWREGNEGDWARYLGSREDGGGPAGFARAQAAVFHRNLECLRREREGCALQ